MDGVKCSASRSFYSPLQHLRWRRWLRFHETHAPAEREGILTGCDGCGVFGSFSRRRSITRIINPLRSDLSQFLCWLYFNEWNVSCPWMNLRVITKSDPGRTMDGVSLYFFLIFVEVTHGLRYDGAGNLQPYMWVCVLLLFCVVWKHFCRAFFFVLFFERGGAEASSQQNLSAQLCAPLIFLSVLCSSRLTSGFTHTSILWRLKKWTWVICAWSLCSVCLHAELEEVRVITVVYEPEQLNAGSRFLQISMRCLLWFNRRGCGEWHKWWACATVPTHCVAHYS